MSIPHALSLLALLPLAACQGISSAPEQSPRVETELDLSMDGSLENALVLESRGDLAFLLEDAILPHADLGLRLYVVPAANYGSEHERPRYALRISIEEFDAFVYQDLVKGKGEQPDRLVDRIDTLTCRVQARIERRRPSGPPLEVGRAFGNAVLRPKANATPAVGARPLTLRYATEDGAELKVQRADVTAVVQNALIQALRGLEEPVDREFTLMTQPQLVAPSSNPPQSTASSS
ncbi:MAG: hypothetical protein WD226_01320 [Planctomycetota bacterium]